MCSPYCSVQRQLPISASRWYVCCSEEIDAKTFNTMRGVHTGRVDESLFADVGSVADDDDDEQSVAMVSKV